MNFIDALYRYEEITRDNKEIYYLHDNVIYKRDIEQEIGTVVDLRDLQELFNLVDWYEYEVHHAPRVAKGQPFYYVTSKLEVMCDIDEGHNHDRLRYESGNYFVNEEDAQHLANVFKRLALIINTKRYDTERDIQEIINTIDNLYPILKEEINKYNKEYIF